MAPQRGRDNTKRLARSGSSQKHCRRLTRLTKAFSKKWEKFVAAVALNFTYYNFCKFHLAVRMTPAMAAGVESSAWTVEELVERCGE